MQVLGLRFFLLLLIFTTQFCYVVQAQGATANLLKADSLYQKQLYIEAAKIYEDVLDKDRFYSPSMLLKLAFIYEAQGNYTRALYFLSLYYHKHPGRSTLKKMEALAQQHNLKGFEYSDYDFFLTQARKYYLKVLEVMLMLAVGCITVSLIAKMRGKKLAAVTFTLYLVLIGVVFYYLNFLSFGKTGIIGYHNAVFMAGPSPGSSLLRVIPAGNQIKLLGEEDIWYKTEFNDTTGYIRQEHILLPN